MEKVKRFPILELTFNSKGGAPLLLDVAFLPSLTDPGDPRLGKRIHKGKTTKALCIALLLAKFAGPRLVKQGRLLFESEITERSWLRSLAEALDSEHGQEFFLDYFKGKNFLAAKRSGLKAWLDAKLLGPDSLELYERAPGAPKKERVALNRDQMRSWAVALEASCPEWHKITAEMASKFQERLDRGEISDEGEDSSVKEQASPLSTNWSELIRFTSDNGKRLHTRLNQPFEGETWYVVTTVPKALFDWRGCFNDAVKNFGVTVKWAYHSPKTASNCHALRAQWETIVTNPSASRGVFQTALEDMNAAIRNFKKWVGDAKDHPSAGSYEFYESKIAHPFMAFMAVPPTSGPRNQFEAPPRTVCMITPYLLQPRDKSKRWALYLEAPHEILNLYYASIIKFFASDETPKPGKARRENKRLKYLSRAPWSLV